MKRQDYVRNTGSVTMPKKPVNKLTRKQKAFVHYLIDNPKKSATTAAKAVYNPTTQHSAEVIASENLSKPDVMAYLQAHDNSAQNIIVEVMNNSSVLKDKPSHARLALDSAKEVLNRVHGLPVARVQTSSTSVNLNLDLTSITSEQIEK